MDTRDFAIGVLTVTAVVLFVGLLLLCQVPQAQAIGQTASGGDYIVATGQLATSTEIVYVLDAAAGRLLGYAYDVNTKRVEPVDGVDLEQLKKPPERDQGRGRGRGR